MTADDFVRHILGWCREEITRKVRLEAERITAEVLAETVKRIEIHSGRDLFRNEVTFRMVYVEAPVSAAVECALPAAAKENE